MHAISAPLPIEKSVRSSLRRGKNFRNLIFVDH